MSIARRALRDRELLTAASFRPPSRGPAAAPVDVLLALTSSDLRARYGRGVWQLVKWLSEPFVLVGVYLLLLTVVLDRANGPAAGLSLACAVIPFQIVMSSIQNALGAVTARRAIILNMAFDRRLIPISSVLTETVAFGASLGLLAITMGAYGIAPSISVLWFPVVVLVNLVLAISAAYMASLFGLWFPSLRLFAAQLVRTLFFLAPGLVPLSEIGGRGQDLLRLNPLTGLFEAYRDVFLYQQRPAAWQLLYPVIVAIVLLVSFVPIYRREQAHFAKVVE